MKLPSAEEYVQIVSEKTEGSLATLHNYRFLPGKGQHLFYEKSRNVIVFKADYFSKVYAIRFFLNDDHELFRRYHEIQKYLSSRPLPWKVPFEFLHDEFYPSMKMDWIESLSFTEYLDSIIMKPELIGELQSKLVFLSRNLEENGIGHGNLNLKHIRFVKQGDDYALKLIDYDSMFIPAFREKDSLTTGTSSFQHPMRLTSDFSEKIDRFSFWVFLTALEAFKTEAALWVRSAEYGYDKQKQVLFNYRDLAIPHQSRAFQIIRSYDKEALHFYADKLTQFCNAKSLDVIEMPRLYGPRIPYQPKAEKPPHEAEMAIPRKEERKTEQVPVIHPPVLTEQKIALPKEKIIEEKADAFVPLKIPAPQKNVAAQEKTITTPVKKKKPTILIAIFAAAFVVVSASIYFIKTPSQQGKADVITEPAPNKVSTPQVQKPVATETVFTQAHITQFLFGLYQSYNKRDLTSILSNYADNIDPYYDAGAVSKNKLSGIIQDLFIKPAYYECQPDITTLQFYEQKGICKLTIAVTETIQAHRRSGKENYSSRIEYTINPSFKILSEKNLE